MEQVNVTMNPEANQFEVTVGGELAGTLRYSMQDDVMSLDSTVVDPRFGGRGIGGQLVQFAAETARESADTKIRPRCPFTVAWFKKHPEYEDVLASA